MKIKHTESFSKNENHETANKKNLLKSKLR